MHHLLNPAHPGPTLCYSVHPALGLNVIQAVGLIDDALAAPMDADTRALVGLARDMLIAAASELDSALVA